MDLAGLGGDASRLIPTNRGRRIDLGTLERSMDEIAPRAARTFSLRAQRGP